MKYQARPSFRNDWLLIALTLACVPAAAVTALGLVPGLMPELWTPGALSLGGLALVLAIGLLFRHYLWRFEVNDRTIESTRGIIGREVRSIRVRDLRNVNVRQSLWQRVLGIGDVEFSSAGGDGIEVIFHGVAAPLDLKERVQSQQ